MMAFSYINAALDPALTTQIDIHALLTRLESSCGVRAKFRKGCYNIECDFATLVRCERIISESINRNDSSEEEEEEGGSWSTNASQSSNKPRELRRLNGEGLRYHSSQASSSAEEGTAERRAVSVKPREDEHWSNGEGWVDVDHRPPVQTTPQGRPLVYEKGSDIVDGHLRTSTPSSERNEQTTSSMHFEWQHSSTNHTSWRSMSSLEPINSGKAARLDQHISEELPRLKPSEPLAHAESPEKIKTPAIPTKIEKEREGITQFETIPFKIDDDEDVEGKLRSLETSMPALEPIPMDGISPNRLTLSWPSDEQDLIQNEREKRSQAMLNSGHIPGDSEEHAITRDCKAFPTGMDEAVMAADFKEPSVHSDERRESSDFPSGQESTHRLFIQGNTAHENNEADKGHPFPAMKTSDDAIEDDEADVKMKVKPNEEKVKLKPKSEPISHGLSSSSDDEDLIARNDTDNATRPKVVPLSRKLYTSEDEGWHDSGNTGLSDKAGVKAELDITFPHKEEMYLEKDVWDYLQLVYQDSFKSIMGKYGLQHKTHTFCEGDELLQVLFGALTKAHLSNGVNEIQALYDRALPKCYRNMCTLPKSSDLETVEIAIEELEAIYPTLIFRVSDGEDKLIIIGEEKKAKLAGDKFKEILGLPAKKCKKCTSPTKKCPKCKGTPRDVRHRADQPPKMADAIHKGLEPLPNDGAKLLGGFDKREPELPAVKGILKDPSKEEEQPKWEPEIHFGHGRNQKPRVRKGSDPFSVDDDSLGDGFGKGGKKLKESDKFPSSWPEVPKEGNRVLGNKAKPEAIAISSDPPSLSLYQQAKRGAFLISDNFKMTPLLATQPNKNESVLSHGRPLPSEIVDGNKPQPSLHSEDGEKLHTSLLFGEENELREGAKGPIELDLREDQQDISFEAEIDDTDLERAIEASLAEYHEEQRRSLMIYETSDAPTHTQERKNEKPREKVAATDKYSERTNTVASLEDFDSDEDYARSLKASFKETRRNRQARKPDLPAKGGANAFGQDDEIFHTCLSVDDSDQVVVARDHMAARDHVDSNDQVVVDSDQITAMDHVDGSDQVVVAMDQMVAMDHVDGSDHVVVDRDQRAAKDQAVARDPAAARDSDKVSGAVPGDANPREHQHYSSDESESVEQTRAERGRGSVSAQMIVKPKPLTPTAGKPVIHVTKLDTEHKLNVSRYIATDAEVLFTPLILMGEQSMVTPNGAGCTENGMVSETQNPQKLTSGNRDYKDTYGSKDAKSVQNLPKQSTPGRNSVDSHESYQPLILVGEQSMATLNGADSYENDSSNRMVSETQNPQEPPSANRDSKDTDGSKDTKSAQQSTLVSPAPVVSNTFYTEHIRQLPLLKKQSMDIQTLYNFLDKPPSSEIEEIINNILNGNKDSADPVSEVEDMMSELTSIPMSASSFRTRSRDSNRETETNTNTNEGTSTEAHGEAHKDKYKDAHIDSELNGRHSAKYSDHTPDSGHALKGGVTKHGTSLSQRPGLKSFPLLGDERNERHVSGGDQQTPQKHSSTVDGDRQNEQLREYQLRKQMEYECQQRQEKQPQQQQQQQQQQQPQQQQVGHREHESHAHQGHRSLPFNANNTSNGDVERETPSTSAMPKAATNVQINPTPARRFPPVTLPSVIFQPEGGSIKSKIDVHYQLPGCKTRGTILYIIDMENGRVKDEGPFAQQEFQGIYYKTFLPAHSVGREVGSLLEQAFEKRRLLTVKRSAQSEGRNIVVPCVPLINDKKKFPEDDIEPYLESIRDGLERLLQ